MQQHPRRILFKSNVYTICTDLCSSLLLVGENHRDKTDHKTDDGGNDPAESDAVERQVCLGEVDDRLRMQKVDRPLRQGAEQIKIAANSVKPVTQSYTTRLWWNRLPNSPSRISVIASG